MDKKKLLILSDSPLTCTGYATISKQIANRMTDKDWDVHFIGHNYLGQTLSPPIKFEDSEEIKFTLHGTGMEPYAKDILIPKIREIKPDVFFILLDTFMTYPWLLDMDFAPAKTVFYFPSDGGGQLPTGCENILRKVNVPVAMAKFGQQQAKEVHNVSTFYIPHAVDPEVYKPANKEEIKKKWGLQGKFIVGTVARNQGRKMLDRTFKAFKLFCKDKPDAILMMHTDPLDKAGVFDLQSLIMREGLQNRVVFSGMTYWKGFTYSEMNEVYNIMDIFILSTSGEGFGIPIIEAMSCEIPVVATNYTTTKELITDNQAGEAVKLAGEITGSWNVERAIMDDEDCAEKLTKLYKDSELRKKYGKNGREAVLKYYAWDIVMNDWELLLNKMTDE